MNTHVPLRSILLATNLSDMDWLFPFTCSLAEESGAHITVVHVVSAWTGFTTDLAGNPYYNPSEAQNEATKYIEEWCCRACAAKIRSEVVAIDGEPAAGILSIANQVQADLLVMGTSCSRGIDKWLHGSVAEHVLRSAPIPVITVGPNARRAAALGRPIKSILFATSLQAGSTDVENLGVILKWTERVHGHLTLLHVLPDQRKDSLLQERDCQAREQALHSLLQREALRGGLAHACVRAGSIVAAFLVIFAASSIAQLLWVARWKPAPNHIVASWASSPQPPRTHPLLVWIVFDELSYDQVFEHRAHDLNLPNFDAMRSESTIFTNTQPAGYHTVKIIPSLLTGKIVDGIRYNFHNRLWVHHESESGWAPIDGKQTVFADAEQAGWRTAAVGWYNPYCAIYSDAIQNCYWTNHDMFDGLMAQNTPFWTNVYTPLEQVVRELKSPARADRHLCSFDVRHRYQTHTDLQQHAFQLLQTDQADFIFFHFSVPHSPNIWSRINGDYTQSCDSSYLDNLALTDRVLGQVVSTLKASPRWSNTTLIVQGDHGWRIDAWNWLPAWTEEDDAASRGVFDQRPALLIHQPGQSQTQAVTSPWPIIQIHSVVEQVLHGQPAKF